MPSNKSVLIMAGGTGGHIFPALAVACALKSHDVEVHWLGTRYGMESSLVGDAFPMNFIPMRAVRGKHWASKLLAPFRILESIVRAYRIIRRLKPSVVLGMGGYAAGPGGIAAKLAGVPLIIHEQNAVAGLTNRILSKFAQSVLAGFPDAFSYQHTVKVVGNPVRPAISALEAPSERLSKREGPLHVLVMGGSQGAVAINNALLKLLEQYPNKPDLHIWHQTGERHYEAMRKAYQSLSVKVTTVPFIKNVTEAYRWADVMICRSGALTVSEVAAAGLASILIPFPYAVDDHQFYNGQYLAQSGAAELIRENELTEHRLLTLIQYYVQNRSVIIAMAEKARRLAKPEALTSILEEIRGYIG